MRVAIKYGLLITVGVAAWVTVKHFVLKQALPPWLDLVVFNTLELAGIVLGIRTQRAASSGLTFKEGLKAGISIAVVYAISACLFFAAMVVVLGPSFLEQAHEPGGAGRSGSSALAGAFAGLFIGATVSGAVFSTIASALLRRARR